MDFVGQLPYVWYYVSVKSNFQHAREECESKRAYIYNIFIRTFKKYNIILTN